MWLKNWLGKWIGNWLGASGGPTPAGSAQSGIRRLAQQLLGTQKPKVSREVLEQIQSEALKPAKITPDPTTPKIIPRPAAAPYQAAKIPKKHRKPPVIYKPLVILEDDPWEHIFRELNKSYLQVSESKLKYIQIRDKAQAIIDDERDVELLLLMH